MITFIAVMTIVTIFKVKDEFRETSNDAGCIVIVLCVISDIHLIASILT